MRVTSSALSHPFATMSSMDRNVTAIAETQHGVITSRQAAAAGLTAEMIKNRLASNRWETMGRGVYRLCGSPRTWQQRLVALTFAAGPLAGASHRSAAALLDIPGFSRRGLPEVTTPRARRHRSGSVAGIVHRWGPFPSVHLRIIDGIVTTRVARTLVDLAGVVHPKRVERAVDNCLAGGTVTLESLRDTFTDLAVRGRKGVAVMRSILSERTEDVAAPASELEERFIELLRAAGLPDPVRQLDVGDGEGWIGRVDFAYPHAGLLVELDGRRHHSALLDRRADARRDDRMRLGGWRHVDRFTWADIAERDDLVVDHLRRRLGGTGDGQGCLGALSVTGS